MTRGTTPATTAPRGPRQSPRRGQEPAPPGVLRASPRAARVPHRPWPPTVCEMPKARHAADAEASEGGRVTQERTVQVLLDRHGTTYAAQAGITLRNKPAPLYRLLVLSLLLSARISADIAVRAAHALFAAGFRTPQAMAGATWQQRVDALGEGGYRRYDERTSTMLGEGADLLRDRWRGDLRRLRDQSGSTEQIRAGLQEFPGIGPTGADIFCREVQGLWSELAPCLDKKTLDGAERLGLPTTPGRLARLVDAGDLPALAAGCVRAALSRDVVDDVREHAR